MTSPLKVRYQLREPLHEPLYEPSAQLLHERVSLEVIDEGRGVAEGLGEQVFEPFFSTRSGGTGLGLSLSRQLVEANGGALSYQRATRGSRFVLTLPRCEPPKTGDNT